MAKPAIAELGRLQKIPTDMVNEFENSVFSSSDATPESKKEEADFRSKYWWLLLVAALVLPPLIRWLSVWAETVMNPDDGPGAIDLIKQGLEKLEREQIDHNLK